LATAHAPPRCGGQLLCPSEFLSGGSCRTCATVYLQDWGDSYRISGLLQWAPLADGVDGYEVWVI
ncbi:unnamed protein product, partial [Effrenium voratum]